MTWIYISFILHICSYRALYWVTQGAHLSLYFLVTEGNLICKLSPFSLDFGGISIYFCNRELNIFQEVFQHVFLKGIHYRQAGRIGEEKTELLWRCRTLHLWSMIEINVSWLQRQINSFQEDRKSWRFMLDPCLLDVFIHHINHFRFLFFPPLLFV